MVRRLQQTLVQLARAWQHARSRHRGRLRRAVRQALDDALAAEERLALATGPLVDLRHAGGKAYRVRISLISLRSGGKTEYWFPVHVPGQWWRRLLGRPLVAAVPKPPADNLLPWGSLVMEASMIIGRQTAQRLAHATARPG
jgi:hypothetical protein